MINQFFVKLSIPGFYVVIEVKFVLFVLEQFRMSIRLTCPEKKGVTAITILKILNANALSFFIKLTALIK